MTEIPVTTAWDILAGALDDPGFWFLSAAGAFGTALLIRHLVSRRLLRWSSLRSFQR